MARRPIKQEVLIKYILMYRTKLNLHLERRQLAECDLKELNIIYDDLRPKCRVLDMNRIKLTPTKPEPKEYGHCQSFFGDYADVIF